MNFMRMSGFALAGAMALLLVGCSGPMPDASASVASTDDAYVVLGVQPHNMMLQIDEAVITDGQIEKFMNTLPLHDYGQGEGDFVVAKVKPGVPLAVYSSSIMLGHSIFGRGPFYPCNHTIAFKVPAGKVFYIANIDNTFFGLAGMDSTYSNDFESAKVFMKIHYPHLAGRLEEGRYEKVTYSGARC